MKHCHWYGLFFVCFTQLVPYIGEEMAVVRVEPCSPAVTQDKQEVLEVCTNVL